ncbi:efflux RND transporter permease subunit [Maribellus maritimus]|uniref:efflux RND transporter permease subunit n=1 Tax=Maribellus maritimus TaxID=2870838 RepID=UPI0021D43BE4|nr:efflux RND transporter permease subunit [Maribellus maritimus]MCG6190390.1 efflux RND transporter permease subunit [Maribellus maritimus]
MFERLLNQKAMISTILFAVLVGGFIAYNNIGKLEDAEIPIKAATVVTVYPGATAHEVELEVTDVLEKAIQKLENIDEITSVSRPGLSMITINIKARVKTPQLPQLWDHLRRKVNDAKGSLPTGAMDPIVNDDFADVYGILYAVTADGYNHEELTKYTEYIERELLGVNGVRRSQVFGEHTQAIDVVFSPEKLAGLSVNPMYIAAAIQNETSIINPGSVDVGKESVRVGVGQKITSIEEIENLLIQVPRGGNFRLGDIATIEKSYLEPQNEALYYNNKPGLTLGLSNESGINVVKLGARLDEKLAEIQEGLPAGIEINQVYYQPDRVDDAVKNFMMNLAMSVGIVIIVLMFAMGLRSGLLISSGLVFTIMGTLIVMLGIGLPLHRVTLAAIILAMGMLVDNAIVVADGILVDLKSGMDRSKAFVHTAKRTALPLLGATAVAILAFLPLRMSPNEAGEFLSSLFTVLIISLSLSWVFAMIQTPFNAKYFYRKERPKGEHAEAYDSKFYRIFGRFLKWGIRNKYAFAVASFAILIFAFWSFRFVKVDFMSKIDYDQFYIEYYLPQGADIKAVEKDVKQIQEEILKIDGVHSVTTSAGRPPARYLLMRHMATGGSNYGDLIVETDNTERVAEIIPEIEEYLSENYPDAFFRVEEYGAAFADADIEAQFTGPDSAVLKDLANQAKKIFLDEPTAVNITDNWKNQTKKLVPEYSVERAQPLGLTRSDMGNSILVATNGMPIGAVYEGDKMLPIVLRTNTKLGDNVEQLMNIPVWGQQSRASVPLSQIADTLKVTWDYELINRLDNQRSIKAQCDAAKGYTAADVQAKFQEKIEAIELPDGYEMKWEGATARSGEANEALFMFLPLAVGLMAIIIIGLFNNLKQPIIIFLIVPFAFIGIVLGLVTTRVFLTFAGIIGALGLIGMMIKNAVVLLDEINQNIRTGKDRLTATIDAALSRLRPVMMASLTTILGMAPLLSDSMFNSTAVVIMFGLAVGSIITLVVVPVLYTVLYRVDGRRLKKAGK